MITRLVNYFKQQTTLKIIPLNNIFLLFQAEQSYEIINERMESYPGLQETRVIADNLKIVGRERSMNGTLIFLDDCDNEHYKFDIKLYSDPNDDGNFKLLPMGVPRMPMCDGLRTYYVQVVQPSLTYGVNTNLPHIPAEGLCPLPKDEYYLKNLLLDTDTWPNQIPRGLLKAKMTIFKDDIDVGAGALVMKITDPK